MGKAWRQGLVLAGDGGGDRDEIGRRAGAVVLNASSPVTYLHQPGPTS